MNFTQQCLPSPLRMTVRREEWPLARPFIISRSTMVTVYTISADTPEAMAEQTATVRTRSILKIKLKGTGDIERVRAVRNAALASYTSPVSLCADETCRDVPTLADITGKYQFINIKLDKTGGLTEAMKLLRAAQSQGLRIMVGCMVGTSLAMAPAALVASEAEFVDLDGPLLLARDREPGLLYRGSLILPQSAGGWGV
ncbi:MAG: enolase C-terminal domain-like protein [Gammaproteobacteria bacterium]